jgi:hypothetical protein
VDNGLIAFTAGGKWLTAPLSPPLEVQPGDTIEVEGTTAWLKRDGHYITSRTIRNATEFTLQPFSEPHTIDHVTFYESKPMPAAAVTINDVVVNQTTGTVTAKFSDGSQDEYTDFAALVADVEDLDTDTAIARKLLLLGVIRRSPDGSNLDVLNGSSCTIDGSAANPVQFSINE